MQFAVRNGRADPGDGMHGVMLQRGNIHARMLAHAYVLTHKALTKTLLKVHKKILMCIRPVMQSKPS